MYQIIGVDCHLLRRTNRFIMKSMKEGPIDMHFKILTNQ